MGHERASRSRNHSSFTAARPWLGTTTALLLAVALAGNAWAQVATVEWNRGTFEREFIVPAGKFVELCAMLEPGHNVAWRFSSQAPMDFNVHYHEGKEVRMPDRRDQADNASGVLAVASREDYCWMWTNKTSTPSTVTVRLGRLKPATQ